METLEQKQSSLTEEMLLVHSNKTPPIYTELQEYSETVANDESLKYSKLYTNYCLIKYCIFGCLSILSSYYQPSACDSADHRWIPLIVLSVCVFAISMINYLVMWFQCYKTPQKQATLHWWIYNMFVSIGFLFVQFKKYQYTKSDSDGKCRVALFPIKGFKTGDIGLTDIIVISMIALWIFKFVFRITITCFECKETCNLVDRWLNRITLIIWIVMLLLLFYGILYQNIEHKYTKYKYVRIIESRIAYQCAVLITSMDTLIIKCVRDQVISACNCLESF